MKQLIFALIGVALFVAAVGILTQKLENGTLPTLQTQNQNGKVVVIGDTTITVEVANSKAEKTKGLSGRSSLAENSGMLFPYPETGIPSFWMKDMQIPLDIIWIAGNKIVDIDKNVPFPEPGTKDSDLPIYQPSVATNYVLEVTAGFADKHGIKIGDSVDLSTAQ